MSVEPAAAQSIGLFGSATPEHRAILSSITERAEADKEANRREAEKRRAATQPKCTEIAVTGYAAVLPEELTALVQSGAPANFAARHPLLCEDRSWGGRVVNGGVVNRSYPSVCRGVVRLSAHRAKVLDWDGSTLRIGTEVLMDTGPRTLALMVQRSAASCIAK